MLLASLKEDLITSSRSLRPLRHKACSSVCLKQTNKDRSCDAKAHIHGDVLRGQLLRPIKLQDLMMNASFVARARVRLSERQDLSEGIQDLRAFKRSLH